MAPRRFRLLQLFGFLLLSFFHLSHTCFQHITLHQWIEGRIVNQQIVSHAKTKASQVKIVVVQGKQINMQPINNTITNNPARIIKFQINRRHQHSEIIERLLFPAINGLTNNHEKHKDDGRSNQTTTDNRMVFEVNRQRHQDKQDDVKDLWNSFVDFETFHAVHHLLGMKEQKQRERLIWMLALCRFDDLLYYNNK